MRTGGKLAWLALMMVAAQPVPAAQKQKLAKNMRPVPVGDPAAWFPPDDYPPEAIRSARQGRSVVEVGVDSTGKAVTCNVKVSSGTAVLDSRTCEIALSRGQFNPATDAKGRPAAGTYLLPVRWVAPDDNEADPRTMTAAQAKTFDMDVEMQLEIGANGKLIACRTIRGKLPAMTDDDPCGGYKPGDQITPGWTRDGRQVGAIITRRMSQTVTVAP